MGSQETGKGGPRSPIFSSGKLATLAIAIFSAVCTVLYEDSSSQMGSPMGSPYGDSRPKTIHEKEVEEKIKSGWKQHNLGYTPPQSESYGTIEVIREYRVGPKTYKDIKYKNPPKQKEPDITDPYIQDQLEDETSK